MITALLRQGADPYAVFTANYSVANLDIAALSFPRSPKEEIYTAR
jgi:hypothetical protein